MQGDGAKLTARHVAIVVCCCLTAGVPVAMLMNTAGIYYPVIAEDFGVQTAEISAWMAIHMISAAVFMPIVGNLVGRFHMRTLMLAGVCMAALAFAVFSQATAPWMFWAMCTVTGILMGTCMFVVPTTLINRWFAKHVGLLIGVYTAFSGIGAAVFLLVGQAILDAWGWRASYAAYSVITLVVCVPAVLAGVRDCPEDCGLLPYGFVKGADQQGEAADIEEPSVEIDDEVRRYASKCMRMPTFWLLLLAGFLANIICQVQGYLPKFIMWLDDQAALGVVPVAFMTGAVITAIIHVGNGSGKIFLGAFSDFSVGRAATVLCISGAAGLLCIWLLPYSPLMALGGLVYGFFMACIPVIIPMLARETFGGGAAYPIIYARIGVAPFIGGAVGNVLLPFLADSPGGFDAMFIVAILFVPVVLACALLALRFGPQKDATRG